MFCKNVARRCCFRRALDKLGTPVASFHQSTSVIADPLGLDRDYDIDEIPFPRNRIDKGTNYELNWSLCAKGVAPNIYAFRNLDDKGLMMRSSGSFGPNKSLVVEDGSGGLGEVTTEAEKDALVDSVKDRLSNVIDLFVHDGALGSHSSCEARVRVVTDSPELALAMKHLLVRVPLEDDSRKQGNVLTLFVATVGAAPASGASLAIVDATVEDGATDIEVAVAGSPSFAALQQLLESQAIQRLRRPATSALPLRCASYATGDRNVALVFDNASSAPVAAAAGLSGAHCQVWSSLGLSRVFDGALFGPTEPAVSRGAVVLRSAATVQRLDGNALTNVAAHPKQAIFVSAKSAKAKKGEATARQLCEEAGHSPEDAVAFAELVKANGVTVHVVASTADAMALVST